MTETAALVEHVLEALNDTFLALNPDGRYKMINRHRDELLSAITLLAERVEKLEAALREYADARHWAILREDGNPSICWIGPGALERPVPNGPLIARAALADQEEQG